ncbi:MAG: hypothetical protein MUP81_01870 [Dehalococcoidia bacterium]|nr:hypothetical protein [Dehalococcoidia bacterium]
MWRRFQQIGTAFAGRSANRPTIGLIKNTLPGELLEQPGPRSSAGPGSNAKMIENHLFKTLYCSHCGEVLKVKLSCGDRTCPECRKKWFGYHLKILVNLVSHWAKPYFLTLTIKNISDNDFGKDCVRDIRQCFGKFRRQFKRKIKGGFYVVQATNRGNGWHLHIHVLFDGWYIPKEMISKAWAEITGGSYIVDIKQIQSPKTAVRYLLSDFLQSPRIRPEDKMAFNYVFKGARLVQSFGCYSKIKLRAPYNCPKCGRCEWIDLDWLLGQGRGSRPRYDDDS